MSEKMNRRDFLKVAAVAGSSVTMATGLQSALENQSPIASQDQKLVTAKEEQIVPGVCSLCPSGCGVLARVADGKVVKLEGSPMHPINLGSLCPKGQAAPELLYNPDRITGPVLRDRETGEMRSITWDEASALVAEKINTIRESGHPESIAMMYGDTRGQTRSFFEYFMRSIGSPNMISKESLNTGAAKLGLLLTQGTYALPVYDLENTNYIISFGASMVEAGWNPQRTISGWTYGRQGRVNRNKIVVIDPRQGLTGSKADEWIPINPGTDAALALGMANVIIRSNMFDSDFVHNYSFGFENFLGDDGKEHTGFKKFVLDNFDPKVVEKITGVPATTIARLAGEFASNKPSLAILPGKGGLLNGSMSGVYAAMAIHMLNALVGAIETKGGVLTQQYFDVPDYPALADDPISVKGLKSDRVDGAGTVFPLARHAYQAVADQVLDGYPLELLFLYDANPVFETPGGTKFQRAFKKIPFIVSFATFMDESAELADLVLPEPTFLERWQDDYIEGLGYPGIALRQPVVTPLQDTLDTPDFFLKITKNLGEKFLKAFPWDSYQDVLKFRLQNIGTDWETLKDLGVWLTPGYRYSKRGDERWFSVIGRDRTKSPRDGYFDFFSRELFAYFGKMNKTELSKFGISSIGDKVALPHHEEIIYQGAGEINLNIFTLMSLGARSETANMPTLQEISGMTVRETWDSWAELNPETAKELGLKDLDMVWIENQYGRMKTRLHIMRGLRPGMVNLPYNQGHSAVGRYAKGRGVNAVLILNPASEPVSGLAAFTNTKVKVYKA